jgi:hypothetical protein
MRFKDTWTRKEEASNNSDNNNNYYAIGNEHINKIINASIIAVYTRPD